MTKDKIVVVAHDADLGRMCGSEYKGKKMEDYNFDDLPKFQKTLKHHLAEGVYELKDEEEGTGFTTLRELFELAPGIVISIDMKDKDDELCRLVDQLVREFKRQEFTVWGSMFHDQHKLV